MRRVANHHEDQDGQPLKRVPLLGCLGRFVARRRWWVLAASLIATLVVGVVAAGAISAFVLSPWEAPGTESVRAQDVLTEEFDTDSANLILLVTAKRDTADSPEVAAAGDTLARELGAEEAVGDVRSYWSEGWDPMLRSDDGRQALVLAWVPGDATEARAEIGELLPEYTRENAAVTVQVAGAEAISAQISESARQDFLRAEIVIIPLMLILLVVVYRRVVPALLTLGVGLFSIFATLAALRGLTAFTEVSTFAANITLVMGIALGIDYSLFVISRFREELARGREVRDAVARSVETAGRTVIFSGLTVAVSVAMLMVFPYPFLRSFGYAGVFVVATALIGAVVILPAALTVLGHRVARRGARDQQVAEGAASAEQGFWYRLGTRVTRRPVVFGGAALLLVVVLGSPALGFRSGLPDDRILPAEVSSTRQAYDEIRANFSQEPQDAINAVATNIGDPGEQRAVIAGYARRLSEVPGVAQVNSSARSFTDGERVRAPGAASERFVSESGTWLEAIPTQEVLAGSDNVDELVRQARAVPAPFDEVLIGGYPAELTDFREALTDWTPLVAALILLVTFVLLFLMTGSLLIPAKATVLNLLSLSVMFGAIVYVFQEGNFSGLLGFTPTGDTNLTFPILMFCFVYGLSMDYEVFMMSRIKEEYDRTGDNIRSVLFGIQRSGPLVTAAAAILALSFALYATADVSFLKMVGVGTAIAILVDATLIRAILVPAFMRLAGRANWWAPAPLRRIHERFGISETEPARPLTGSRSKLHQDG